MSATEASREYAASLKACAGSDNVDEEAFINMYREVCTDTHIFIKGLRRFSQLSVCVADDEELIASVCSAWGLRSGNRGRTW